MGANAVALAGELKAIEPLRYTPAGVPMLRFTLLHRSQQTEAGFRRAVECEMSGIAMGEAAVAMAGMRAGQPVRVRGFLDRRSRASAQPVLHATEVNVSEERGDGDTQSCGQARG